MNSSIPVVDLFAGPGGLGEGFSSALKDGRRPFRIAVSVEKDAHAHKTLSLRAFYRWFLHEKKRIPKEYYQHLAGDVTLEDLFSKYPHVQAEVKREALCAELGKPDCQPLIDKAIHSAVKGKNEWLLIGGPPCQAYSLVGRSRMQNAQDYRNKRGHEFAKDHRHYLYREYLRIIYKYSPSVFVMENVKGILSAKLNGDPVFPRIIHDLKCPQTAAKLYGWRKGGRQKYHIVSFVTGTEPDYFRDYLIKCENHGIPQARHRVILLGIRDDIWCKINGYVEKLIQQHTNSVAKAIAAMPHLRSGFSKGEDSHEKWIRYFKHLQRSPWVAELDADLRRHVVANSKSIVRNVLARKHHTSGAFLPGIHKNWYRDSRLLFIPNHETRSHMDSDLDRYLFVASYGELRGLSPRLKDFPASLLPCHKNVKEGIKSGKFADRF